MTHIAFVEETVQDELRRAYHACQSVSDPAVIDGKVRDSFEQIAAYLPDFAPDTLDENDSKLSRFHQQAAEYIKAGKQVPEPLVKEIVSAFCEGRSTQA
mgnify:CR=1 FL=1